MIIPCQNYYMALCLGNFNIKEEPFDEVINEDYINADDSKIPIIESNGILLCPRNNCTFQSESKKGLSYHLTQHNDCSYCGQSFYGKNGKRNLKIHVKRHENPRIATCEICNVEFKKPYLLKRHKKSCYVGRNRKRRKPNKTTLVEVGISDQFFTSRGP